MAIQKLAAEDLAAALSGLAGWTLDREGRSLHKVFKFRDFQEAFAFMARIALLAERKNHHPDWSNRYGTVDVTLSTHDAGGVTSLDIALATAMDEFAARLA
jgi:4a-hydroxytetrahydrobiopterin dehydratase